MNFYIFSHSISAANMGLDYIELALPVWLRILVDQDGKELLSSEGLTLWMIFQEREGLKDDEEEEL